MGLNAEEENPEEPWMQTPERQNEDIMGNNEPILSPSLKKLDLHYLSNLLVIPYLPCANLRDISNRLQKLTSERKFYRVRSLSHPQLTRRKCPGSF